MSDSLVIRNLVILNNKVNLASRSKILATSCKQEIRNLIEEMISKENHCLTISNLSRKIDIECSEEVSLVS